MSYDPKFTVTAHLLKIIEEIAGYREAIRNAAIQVSWIPALQKDSKVRNTHGSTAIEGNPLTLEEVRILEDGGELPAKSARSRREVLNYFAALRFIERRPREKSINKQDILKLHKIISTGVMDQGEPGKYRNIKVRVGNYLPPAPEHVRKLMAELLEWWNERSSKWSPVISSAVVHYRFEAIHPFADGNGRVGRALAMWELYRRGFDTHHIFSVDEIYWEARQQYYKALDQARQHNDDLTGWLEYSAEAIHMALEQVLLRIGEIKLEAGPEKIILRPRQEQLLKMLKAKGGMSPSEIWENLNISKQGALDLINPLLKAGLVRRIGTKKSGKYVLG